MDSAKNAVIYVRDSAEQSIDFQINEIETFAFQNDFTIVGRYVDASDCGLEDSAGLNKMLVDVVIEKFKYVIVYRIDMLSKNMTEVLEIYDYFTQINIYLVSVIDPVDTSTPKGRIMLEMIREWGNTLRELLG